MFLNSRVVWSEGMLLQQQHLQQHDRYLHSKIERLAGIRRGYGWGVSRLVVDEGLLALGKFALLACEGIMPDGTTLALPAEDDLPAPLDISEAKRDALIVLALPLRRPGIAEFINAGNDGEDSYARYRCAEYEVFDSNADANESAYVQVGRLRLKLAFEDSVGEGYVTLGVARVIERRDDGYVVLDKDYVPPCIDYRVASKLSLFVNELVGLLHQRGNALAKRLAQPMVNGVAEIHDFLLLQTINRAETLFGHLTSVIGLHPETLYRELLQLYGEIAGFTREGGRPLPIQPYRHDALITSFEPLMDLIRRGLSMVTAPQAIGIPMEQRQYGLRVGLVHDLNLFTTAAFVLAVKADMPVEALCAGLSTKMKIGPVEHINDLVNLQLPGLHFRLLPAAPRQLPFHAGFAYFSLDAQDASWSKLSDSGGIALHIAGDFPGLDIQLWAVRQ